MLEILGHRLDSNRALCPETSRLLERVPNLIQAFISILEPGKSVPEHEGPYRGYLRYHLGLRIPKENPPKLVINGQDYIWKEGEAVMFDGQLGARADQSQRRDARRPDRRHPPAAARHPGPGQPLRHGRGGAAHLRAQGGTHGSNSRRAPTQAGERRAA